MFVEEAAKTSAWLLEHKSNVYSQTGEDGVIAEVLRLLPVRDNWCVEFGAWDGEYLCNVCNLIRNQGYSAVLIEANTPKFGELQKAYHDRPDVHMVNQFVGFQPDDNLDTILEKTPIPLEFDFLSIDIDGNDYHVWKMVTRYRPKVVCIEFNPTMPKEVSFVQEANPNVTQGSSVSAIVALGKEKGYELVSIVGCNAILVDAQYFPLFQIADNSVEALWVEQNDVTYLFVGYDGKVFLQGKETLPWHGLPLKASDVNILPAFLQKYPGNYGTLERVLFAVYLLFRNPKYLLTRVKRLQEKRASNTLIN